MNFFKANYHEAKAVFVHNGVVFDLLQCLSGVLQGCPGSAMMVNNAQDPFLARFHNALREKQSGIIRAAADDIGITLTQLRHLRIVHPIFGECKAHGGLNVKPPKCFVVPLCKWSEQVQKGVSRWLRNNLPDWANFKVASSAKYLGFFYWPRCNS